MTTSHVVIVGGGLAAARVAEELREQQHTGPITMVSAEAHLPYDRPPLSKQVLRGEVESTTLPVDWAALDVDVRPGRRAVALHPDLRSVLLDDGEELTYDALVVATGAQPRQLPGLTGDGVHVLRTFDDSTQLAQDIRRTQRVVVIGAGFIGCEVAASARVLGAEVTLIEVLPAPLARVLGTTVGREVADLHEKEGVELLTGVSVVEPRGAGDGRELLLSDGRVIPAPVVVVGLGVLPDTSWLDGSGVEVDDGVVCDSTGRTSVEGVWAAGDVARWWHPSYQAHVRLEHWTSAADQGAAVGRDIAGVGAPLDEVPYFWSDQYKTKWQMLGRPEADDEVTLLRVGPNADKLLAVYGRDGRVSAVLGAGAPRAVMRMRQAIADRMAYDDAVALASS